ncbi:ABC transporter, substrate-binding protein (cluster 12, methionine/phosphonates) [uncultured Synechococcales cyanobacterium]|uniref:ABC transporter, substrate-binding protein (Cluster 12, methionine/phosphonates) n=1 Tax=uncultured Synechococcales cyanobacterium TaxID=1936017 RepID=A0A6J4V2X9_9CYAN|nr:ABC transporter, substrate-binding protein (cluster 12, methionine/phosphonates) [uncultured Synechococcales cyanobacterium]
MNNRSKNYIHFVPRWLRRIILGTLALVLVVACSGGPDSSPEGQAPTTGTPEAKLEQIKFGVGPYFPTPGENRKQFEPLFQELAKQVNLPAAEVAITEDWVGISEALRSGTLDAAWLGPWGFVLAQHNEPSIQAIATVKYKDKPTYQAVLMARADAPFDTLDQAISQSQTKAKLKLSLADVGSTSGWLVPQAEFKRRQIDPKTVFDYNEGASHAAQAIAVLSGQTDIASDYDRNLDVLVSEGRIDQSKLKIIWQSNPLPNDAIAVRGGLPDAIKTKVQTVLVNFSPEQAKKLLPQNYTGFVKSDGSNYAPIEAAGRSVGTVK